MAPPCLSSLASRITRHSTLIALVLVAAATLFSVACSHAADAPAKTGSGRTVRAGIFNFKPLVIFDQESPPTGFIVDILNHIAKQEEWNVEYVPGTWQGSLERLRTDKIDIILCIGYSAERDEYLDFPKEHVLLDWGLLYRGKGSSITTILDMEGKTIAAMKASIYTDGFKNTLEQFNIKAKIVEKTEVKDVFGALESGEVDAAISSTIAGIPFESSQKVDRSPVVFTPVKLGYAVNSGKNADLTAAIDKRLAELKSDKDSYYYKKLDEWVTASSHTVPKMFYWIIGGISGALIVFIVFVIILRLQVKAKTNSLKVELEQRKRTEAELMASVEDLRDSQSIAHVGSWRLDSASNQVVWSEELYKMYGFDPKLPPPPYTEHQKLFTPESWERLSAALQNTKNTGIPYNLELKTLRPDGSSGWMWVRGMSVLDADGATVGLRGMAQDITERKRLYEELKKERRRLVEIISATDVGTWEWNLQTGEVVFNDRLAEMVGYSLVELSPISIDTWFKLVHPADLQQSENLLERHFKRELDHYECEARMRHKSGEWIWILDRGQVVEWSADGKPLRMSGTHLDISERKHAEAQLLRNRHALEKSQEIGMIGTWELDIVNNKLLWTDENCRIFGVPNGAIVNYEVFISKVHPDDRDYVEREWQASLTGKPYDIEHRLLIDGKVKWVRGKAQLIFDPSGKAISAIGVTQDISDRRQLMDDYRRSAQLAALGTVAAGVAHEINNPIQGIINYATLIGSSPNKTERVVDMSGRIVKEGNRIAVITKDLLHYAKDNRGEFRVIDILEPIKAAISLLNLNYKQSEVRVALNLPFNPVLVKVNPQWIQQVVVNLVENAFYAVLAKDEIHENDEIRVVGQVVEEGDASWFRLEILDSGIGIPTAILDKVRDAFFTTKQETKGTGLGLSIVGDIVAKHQGTLEIESEEGSYTKVAVSFPVAPV